MENETKIETLADIDKLRGDSAFWLRALDVFRKRPVREAGEALWTLVESADQYRDRSKLANDQYIGFVATQYREVCGLLAEAVR